MSNPPRFSSRAEYEAWKQNRFQGGGAAAATLDPPCPTRTTSTAPPAAPAAVRRGQPVDLSDEEKAIKQAVGAGIVSGVLTLIVTLIAMSGTSIMGMTGWSLFDVALIFGLTFGIARKNRACAVIMLVYFVASKLYMWSETGKFQGIFVAALFAYWYYRGVVGTFSYHQKMHSV